MEKCDNMKEETQADVLEGDFECPGIVDFSVYDNNPVKKKFCGGLEVGVEHQ